MGVPIRASMETVEIGRTAAGVPVFCAREALSAEGLIVVNRVKPHTDFESTRLGSGLLKMCAIGLGKVDGAGAAHRAAALHGYEASILAASRLVRSRVPLIAGVGLVEDPHHHLAVVEVIPAAAIEDREPALLAQARSWMPALPFSEIDVLIIDEIGKNISGAGMDTNVIGRGVHGEPFRTARARARVIYARGLTPQSHGNAVGHGHGRHDLLPADGGHGPARDLHERDHRPDSGHRARADALRHRRRVPARGRARQRRRSRARRASCACATRWPWTGSWPPPPTRTRWRSAPTSA